MSINIRVATDADFEFIDELQKLHNKQLGFMHRKTLETYIEREQVLIAEQMEPQRHRDTEEKEYCFEEGASPSVPQCLSGCVPVGYIVGCDRYFKREDVGIIYQIAVVRGSHRSLIGAALVKAMFDRAAYGCKLFCCWCAQDLEANYFWESLGFVPLAFRTGSERASRIHIFWQRRIREGDAETLWWFPSQTTGGAIREDRLVIPIPPGTHWSDAKPVILPGIERDQKVLPDSEGQKGRRPKRPKVKPSASRPKSIARGGFRFVEEQRKAEEKSARREARKKRRAKRKNDPKLIAQVRELRDRFLEEVERRPELIEGAGKYDVSRQLGAGVEDGECITPIALLEAA